VAHLWREVNFFSLEAFKSINGVMLTIGNFKHAIRFQKDGKKLLNR
jgi:hypothetical protein